MYIWLKTLREQSWCHHVLTICGWIYNIYIYTNISYTAVYSTIYHVSTIREMILDGLFPRPLKTLLPEVWLKAVPHERSCSWGRCVYLEPGKLVEVLTKITRVVFANCPFFHPSRQWWFQSSLVVHPSLRKANDNCLCLCGSITTCRVHLCFHQTSWICLFKAKDPWQFWLRPTSLPVLVYMTVSSRHSRQL